MKDPYSLIANLGFAQLWHRDRNGADGACGWCFPVLTDEQMASIKNLGFWEGREHHFLRYAEKEHRGDLAERETLYRAAVLLVARVLKLRMSFDEAAKIASLKFAVGGCEGADGLFCFLPGYHSNYPEDRNEDRADRWTQICYGIARSLLASRRRWWQHPRWHVHHWRLHVPVLKRCFDWSGVR